MVSRAWGYLFLVAACVLAVLLLMCVLCTMMMLEDIIAFQPLAHIAFVLMLFVVRLILARAYYIILVSCATIMSLPMSLPRLVLLAVEIAKSFSGS